MSLSKILFSNLGLAVAKAPSAYRLKPDDFGNSEHSAEWLFGITEQLDGLRSLALGGTIGEICNQKELYLMVISTMRKLN